MEGGSSSTIFDFAPVTEALNTVSTQITSFVSDNFTVILGIVAPFVVLGFIWLIVKWVKKSANKG